MEIKDINMIEPAERSKLSDEEYNKILLAQRQREYDERVGPRTGDYVIRPDLEDPSKEVYDRITYIWPEHDYKEDGRPYRKCQCGGSENHGGYYLGNGYQSYSGVLSSGCRDIDLELTDEVKEASVWFFNRNYATAHNDVHLRCKQRVYRLKPGANADFR